MSSSLVSREKLTDYTVTLESNLAHYQKEPDSYSWKNKWITWAPVAQGIQEQNQVDHLGPHGPKGFKSQSQVDHLGPSGPRDPRAKPGGSLGPPWAQGIQEPKNPSPCSSNIREPDYLRHWYSGWGNSGSLMLLLQGRVETRKETRKACATEAKWKEKNANADRSLPSRNPMRFSFHLASGPNEKKKTQTPIVRFLQETQRVFSFHLAPRGIFFFFFSFFFLFFFNLFTFFFKCARRMGKTHRQDGDPYPAQKKFVFF